MNDKETVILRMQGDGRTLYFHGFEDMRPEVSLWVENKKEAWKGTQKIADAFKAHMEKPEHVKKRRQEPFEACGLSVESNQRPQDAPGSTSTGQ